MSNIRCEICGMQINPNANTHGCQPIGSTTSGFKFGGTQGTPPTDLGNPNEFGTLTPLGEALQTLCARCNRPWIQHDCPIKGGGVDLTAPKEKGHRGDSPDECPICPRVSKVEQMKDNCGGHCLCHTDSDWEDKLGWRPGRSRRRPPR